MKTETVYITCDVCNANEADELRFGYMGRDYAVDLCSTCRAIFDNLIEEYVNSGRKVTYRNHVVRKDSPQRISTVNGDKPVNSAPRKRGRPKMKNANHPPEVSS